MLNGNKIREVRTEKGYTQEEVGSLIHVSKVTISGYERGERQPTLDKFELLIDHLHLSADEALGREVSIINEDGEPYGVKMTKKEIAMVKEIRKHHEIYDRYMDSPERTSELIMLALRKLASVKK